MKKNYVKPSITFESFETEGIMTPVTSTQGTFSNVLSFNSAINQSHLEDASSGVINFSAGSENVLNSIDYSEFLK